MPNISLPTTLLNKENITIKQQKTTNDVEVRPGGSILYVIGTNGFSIITFLYVQMIF